MKSKKFLTIIILGFTSFASMQAAVIPVEQLSFRVKSKTEMVNDIQTMAPNLLPIYEKHPENDAILDVIHTIATSTKPVVVKFYSNYCGPCRSLSPVVEKVSNFFDSRALFIEVDTTKYRSFASAFEFRFIPTLLFFNQGKEVARCNSLPEDELRTKVEALI